MLDSIFNATDEFINTNLLSEIQIRQRRRGNVPLTCGISECSSEAAWDLDVGLCVLDCIHQLEVPLTSPPDFPLTHNTHARFTYLQPDYQRRVICVWCLRVMK